MTRTCAFKAGFAPEGMLCNVPPIPLRVLDFLGTYDIVNLSLVCKAMHQAGHVLLEREVRGPVPRHPQPEYLLYFHSLVSVFYQRMPFVSLVGLYC